MNIIHAKIYITKLFSVFLLCLMYFAVPYQLQAQIIDPLREYTNPDEVVTFDRNTTYTEAIAIINTFAQEYENKFIVDKSGYSGPIGVNLPPMHWKDALAYVLRFQNLEVNNFEDYYEIVKQVAPQVTSGANTSTTTQNTGGGGGPVSNVVATTKTREIRINATFFEGNKRALREIGIDWSTLTNSVPENLADFVTGNQGERVPQTDFSDQFVSVNSFNASSVSQNAFNALVNLGEIGPGISVQALFSAFEADNLGKVLATPSIKVIDGEEANLQVGQDFSIKQRDIAGNVTDNFVSTGTILTVTPQIITQGDTSFVYLELAVERSTVQPDVVSTIINKQEATTSAMLLDGEATYVAGLFRTEETSVRRGVPILKDLPGWFFGLRYLFGYNSNDISENELIIIVQAELIKPISERMNERRLTKREVLDNVRDGFRTDLDRVFEIEDPELPSEVLQVQETDTVTIEEPIAKETEPEIEEEEEEPVVVESEVEEELTDDQKQLAEDLSIPVQNPELMIVVPKAFDLDQYLKHKEEGIEVEEDNTNLKFFVIGGSFLVPNNAYNFMDTLEKEGYNTRMLFNTRSRFHFVAFEGFSNFDNAVETLRDIQQNVLREAWLFTIQSDSDELRE
ncbi:MAG: type II and III secretion system protein [Balneolaceae bacterium]